MAVVWEVALGMKASLQAGELQKAASSIGMQLLPSVKSGTYIEYLPTRQ
jgi:hypothetical protein